MNADNGGLMSGTFGSNLFDTPVRTIQVIKIVQSVYREKIRREMKNAKA